MSAPDGWVRSSFCGNVTCVEVQYVRASGCADTSCVEVGHDAGAILVRNSQDPEQVLQFSRDEWTTFLDGVLAGEFRFGGEPVETPAQSAAIVAANLDRMGVTHD